MSGFANSLIGMTLGGYSIQRMIARGGMGIVYEGVQESLGRRVAVKVLYPHLGEDESFRERFQREARAIAQLRHSNIVGVIDFGSDQSFHYMVMDLIDGPSLRDELSRRHQQGKPFSTEDSLEVIGRIAAALSYAHARGMVHRDVKPANVMLDADGEVYLTDFGLVKLADSQNVTVAGMIVGTPEYMAPEQSSGVVDVTPAADQYSLAILAYQLLVGRVPFSAPTPVGVIHKHISEPPPPPHTIVPTFPLDVERVLMRGLSKEPTDRYPSVDAFYRDLAQVSRTALAATAVVATPVAEAVVPGSSPSTITGETPAGTSDAAASIQPRQPVHDPNQATAPTPVIPATLHSAGTGQVSQSAPGASPAWPAAGGAGSFGTPPPASYGHPSGSSGPRRMPVIAIVIALALLLLGGGIAAAVLLGGDDKPDNPEAVATSTREAEPTNDAGGTATSATGQVVATTPPDAPATATLAETPTAEPTPTDLPTQVPAEATPTTIRRVIPSPTPFVINPITPTPSPTPVLLGAVTGPSAEVEVRNYMSVPTWVELVGLGSFVAQPGQYEWRVMPAGTWSYIQSAAGYTSLEGEIVWEEGGRYFWEFYDGDEVEIVQIQNNLGVPMTLEFDGWGELYVDAGSSVSRAFPAGEYEYSFRAEGYNDRTSTVRMDAGARTTWPFNPS